MKKLIITLAAMVLATSAFAQLNFGVKVGGNLSSISGMVSEDSGRNWGDIATVDPSQSMKPGFNAGLYAEYMVCLLWACRSSSTIRCRVLIPRWRAARRCWVAR